ncbi:MAG: ATP-binding cassette domain-containing protein, partial [Alphaproteobacteria bacterium]|nr:ATP-binding cassette domain-containing protein [Alphaproteobacteria bacterium]
MAVLHPALRFEDLTVAYDRHPAVHHFSGVLPRGALAALVGPNGAGKSSVFKAVVGLAPKMEGRVDLCGLSPADIAYLPQQAELDRSFPITVADAAMLGHLRRVGFYGEIGPEPRARAAAALAAVGLAGFEARPIGTLSVGQLQRALFARILLQDAPLILLDEPFNALDGRTVADLLAVVRRWHGESRTVVAILHDL